MRVVLRVLLSGTVLLGLGAGIASAQGTSFSGAPTLGDRSISWEWEAIQGLDPYFQGNTVLELIDDLQTTIPGDLRILRSNYDGTVLCAVSDLDDTVYVLDAETGETIDRLSSPPSRLLAIEIHRSAMILLGGLEDGRVAVWDRRAEAGDEPTIYEAQKEACRFVRFFVAANDPEEQRFVTAGDEDTVRVWLGPGSLFREISTSGMAATSIDLTESGSLMAVGDSLGSIRIYEPTKGTVLQRLDEHEAPVTQLIFTADHERLVSLDSQGKVVSWDTGSWTMGRGEIALDEPEGAIIAVRQPDASLIYAAEIDSFKIYDGWDGRRYRSGDLVPEGDPRVQTLDVLGRRVFAGLSDGIVRSYRTGFCTPSPSDTVCFGGYQIWRSPTPDPDDAVLLRIYGFGDSTWSFSGLERQFVDPDSLIPRGSDPEDPLAGPHNGLPYYYSVTAFERRYLNGAVFDVFLNSIDDGFYRRDPNGDPTAVFAHAPDRREEPLLARVIVVPNPYEAGRVPWDGELGPHVEFRNLPAQATIRIYTVSGELLRTIEHGSGDFGEPTDSRAWDLRNASGENVTSGVYIFHVTTKLTREEATGYFIVVR